MTNNNIYGSSSTDTPEAKARCAEAMALIRKQRTMVLATGTGSEPWAAPVYYVYGAPGFYFFSKPNARHIEQSLAANAAAASIFADSDQWTQIQGLQMNGKIQLVEKLTEQLKIGTRFILKFPFAEPFLRIGKNGKQPDDPPNIGDRVKLYAFLPRSIYYVNNQLGFGKRLPVELR